MIYKLFLKFRDIGNMLYFHIFQRKFDPEGKYRANNKLKKINYILDNPAKNITLIVVTYDYDISLNKLCSFVR